MQDAPCAARQAKYLILCDDALTKIDKKFYEFYFDCVYSHVN